MKSERYNKILLTGASGFLGHIILSRLLADYQCDIIILLRPGAELKQLKNNVEDYLKNSYISIDNSQWDRVMPIFVSQPGESLPEGIERKIGVIDAIFHAAGNVDYFDTEQLHIGNVQYTSNLIQLAKRCHAQQFIYVSTAFSSGYKDMPILEQACCPPFKDPTAYVTSKRHAEALVEQSGIPYFIMRPSIVIGHSKTGYYRGKRYGLYQQWMLMEKLFHNHYIVNWHYVANKKKLQLVHCDSFENMLFAAIETLPVNTHVNIVSESSTLPSYRDAVDLWFKRVLKPKSISYYDDYDSLPLNKLSRKERMFFNLIKTNTEIATASWFFETASSQKIQAKGIEINDVTLASLLRCQNSFVKQSSLLNL